ncbi:MAG: prolipoprotein diacylglyceryl transferase [Planctomycetes bacterium]|nr:prolipoprotein diacylglyceryl transferase [Planctomycetota bacterium]
MEFPAWDPVLFDIPGLPIDVRWYGLMYVVGFLAGHWILVRLARARFFPVPPEAAGDLIFYCVFGVMLGGRLGYALFYQHDLLNPLNFLQVWKGGLAFHGGLGGVAVALWLFCRKHRIGWMRTGDACALAVTPGIFAVRCANFINGELYGRVTRPGTGLAMQFPTDPQALRLLHIGDGWSMRDRELCLQVAYGKRTFAEVQPLLRTKDDFGVEIDWAAIAPRLDWQHVRSLTDVDGQPLVPYRHASQLYEALGEGLLVGLILLACYLLTRRRPLRPGRYAVLFLLGYAAVRASLELVRQPDSWLGEVFLGLTMGQILSGGLVVGAVLMWFWPQRQAAAGGGAGDAVSPAE